MAQTTAQKAEIIEKFAQSKGDTGSPQVQVALLTARHQRTHRALQS